MLIGLHYEVVYLVLNSDINLGKLKDESDNPAEALEELLTCSSRSIQGSRSPLFREGEREDSSW